VLPKEAKWRALFAELGPAEVRRRIGGYLHIAIAARSLAVSILSLPVALLK
jgi:hypothetical protein